MSLVPSFPTKIGSYYCTILTMLKDKELNKRYATDLSKKKFPKDSWNQIAYSLVRVTCQLRISAVIFLQNSNLVITKPIIGI